MIEMNVDAEIAKNGDLRVFHIQLEMNSSATVGSQYRISKTMGRVWTTRYAGYAPRYADLETFLLNYLQEAAEEFANDRLKEREICDTLDGSSSQQIT